MEVIDYEEVFWMFLSVFGAHGRMTKGYSLVRFAEAAGGAFGCAGKCDTISFLKSASDFPLVVVNASISNETFFRSVEKDMKMILLLDIF